MKSLLLAACLSLCAFAQGVTDAPSIIQIVCKPGSASGPVRPYAEAKAGIDVVGLAAVTGLPQTWTIQMHPSFASLETLDRALVPFATAHRPSDAYGQSQDDLLAPPRTMTAVLQTALSYHPNEAIRAFPKARYMRVSIHVVRAGLEAGFAELQQLRLMVSDSMSLDRPDLAYQVISGARDTTFVILSPVSSLRIFDEGVPDVPNAALPLAEAKAKAAPKAADVEVSRERLLFRVEPRLSYVSDSFASADPEFWKAQ